MIDNPVLVEEVIRAGISIGIGCVSAVSFSVLGYLSTYSKKVKDKPKKKGYFEYARELFNVDSFVSIPILGGLAGFGILYLGVDYAGMESILVYMGIAASGKKVWNVVSSVIKHGKDKLESMKK